MITCEFDVNPLKETSRSFRVIYELRMIDTRRLNSEKVVAMQELQVVILL